MSVPNADWCAGYAAAMKEAAAVMRETSRREIEDKPGDTAVPLGAVGRWFRDHAKLFEQRATDVAPRTER